MLNIKRLLQIWDIAKKRIRKIFQGHTHVIYSLAFSSDGRSIVSGSGDRTTRIWDMTDRLSKTIATTGSAGGVITCMTINSDGRLVAVGDHCGVRDS